MLLTFIVLQGADPVVECILNRTEEGQKVTRNKGDKFPAVYRRL